MAVTRELAAEYLGGVDLAHGGAAKIIELALETAGALIEGYAPEAPETVKDMAALRVVARLWEDRGISSRVSAPSVLATSGARALLADYRGDLTLGVAGGAGAAEVNADTSEGA